jgi:zinc-ribbon domain
MAFCNSCGTTLAPGTKFCTKCGATVTGSPAAAMTPAPPAVPKGGGSALKIVLIVVAVIVGIGILGVAGVSYFAYRVAKSAHVRQEGNNVKVETPFGTVETSQDPEKAAKDLGIDIYPGAEVQKNGSSSATFGQIHTVNAMFSSSDSVDKVCTFYKSKFPNAMVSSSDQNRCNIVSNDPKNMITINIQSSGDTTRIQITSVSKKAASSN